MITAEFQASSVRLVSDIWPSGLQQARGFDMFRRLQIYAPYLEATRKAGLLGDMQVWLLLSSWKTPGAD